jgi:hypothetical protein
MLATALPAAPPPPAPPTILGPRETESLRVTYRFLAARAVGFRCAFDSVRLHRCGSSYSERLAPGTHVLRVRAVARDGRQSRVVKVRVLILMPLPPLAVGSPVSVGPGAGVPAVGNGDVWVPTTNDGMLARVSGGAVVSRTRVGAPGGDGFLDSAVRAGGSVWSASDAGATVSRVAPAATVAVAERPGGLTEGGGAVWAFHFLRGTVTRIEASTAVATTLEIDGARATGLAYGDDTLWLLTTGPARVLRIDPASGRVTRSTPLVPPFALSGSLIDTWWLAYGEGAVWATLPNYRAAPASTWRAAPSAMSRCVRDSRSASTWEAARCGSRPTVPSSASTLRPGAPSPLLHCRRPTGAALSQSSTATAPPGSRTTTAARSSA